MDVTAADVEDLAGVGALWRALEERADGSFFQGWTWIGCLATERFPSPLLVTARRRGQVIGLGLFNQVTDRWGRRLLHLGESGDPTMDGVYTEHNGFLLDRSAPAGLGALLERAARTHASRPGRPAVVVKTRMAFAQELTARAIGSRDGPWPSAPAWVADLGGSDGHRGEITARFGSNTRHAVRRSIQAYAADGPLTITRATTVAEAREFFDRMVALHQAHWNGRGQPGAFAAPFMRRFHHALISTGLPRDEIDLLRVHSPRATLGILYNFRYRRSAYAYQSGFAPGSGNRHERPGLVSHSLCMAGYQAAGIEAYDFLAGDVRYKRDLSNTYALMT